MQFSLSQQRIAFLTAACLGSSQVLPAAANPTFDNTEVHQDKFVLMATPYNGGSRHQLTIVEQKKQSRDCWAEETATAVSTATAPVVINPLLLGFNFSGICGRSTDSNGYSIRVGGEDLNWRYTLKIIEHNNEMMLVGIPTSNPAEAKLLIARSNGETQSFSKLELEPGWRLTKRAYNGKTLGHLYLTHDETLATLGNMNFAAAQEEPSLAEEPSLMEASQVKPNLTKPNKARR